MTRRLLFSAALAVAVALGGLLAPACSNQSEGERCDTRDDNNGNDDCTSPLTCQLRGTGTQQGDYCCPPQGVQATTAICTQQPTAGNADAAPVEEGGSALDTGLPSEAGPETSTPGDSGSDAPVDAPLDAPTDSPADAPADAPDAG